MVRISGLTAKLNPDGNKWILDLRKDITCLQKDHSVLHDVRQKLDPMIDPDIPVSPQSAHAWDDPNPNASTNPVRTVTGVRGTFMARSSASSIISTTTATTAHNPYNTTTVSRTDSDTAEKSKEQDQITSLPEIQTRIKAVNAPTQTLADVLGSQPPEKFRCRVKCTNVSPVHVRDYTILICTKHQNQYARDELRKDDNAALQLLCSCCQPPNHLKHVYAFKLHLIDDTGEVDAFVAEEDAVEFLGDAHPPLDMYANQDARRALEERLGQLRCVKLRGMQHIVRAMENVDLAGSW